MTGDSIMHLDLKAEGDEGLLMPFGNASNKSQQDDEHNPLFAPPPAYKQTRRSFFRRRERKPPEPKLEEPQDEQKNVKKQAVTFKFPSAPQAFAEDEETDDPYKDASEPKSTQKQVKPPEKKKEDLTVEESSSSEEETEKGNKTRDSENCAPPSRRQTRDGLNAAPTNSFRNQSHPRLSDSKAEACQMMKEYTAKRLEGHGNSQPEPDAPLSGFNRFLKRLRGPEMKAMRIATEDTKDQRTLGETVTHVMQVALVPEVYADDMEGEGNLGFYRPIRSTPDRHLSRPPASQQRVMDSVKFQKENNLLKKKVSALQDHVNKLEETIKTKDLEAALWKLRAQELEEELRKYKGQNDDNSTAEPLLVDPDHESENEIDHKWNEKQHSTEIKENVLVDTTFVPKEIMFDPLKEKSESKAMVDTDQESKQIKSEEGNNDNDEADMAKEDHASESPVVIRTIVEESDNETDDEDGEGNKASNSQVKEEVLVDTNIGPEPIVFDPMEVSAKGKDDDITDDICLI